MPGIDTPYWLVRPRSAVTAGVVVIHEGNGMSAQMLRLCERLGAEGYAVVAPDLFFRTGGPGATDDYRVQYGAVNMDEMLGDLAVAADALRAVGAGRIGVTGFCMGGRFAWHAARHGGGFDAAVGFYGSGIAADLGPTECPTLLFFGGRDAHIPAADIDQVIAAHPDTVVYPEAGHGFMRDGSADHVTEAATDAWRRTLGHFARHLGVSA
ncbi:MAG TPA: dienelactone hydrolase family protein [Acidimicrobiales bacterium]|nr:dienelactone hydrolase family protein [Acidimicrobiales bacterium]